LKKAKIRGACGKWTAEFDEQMLPVIHNLEVIRTQEPDGVMNGSYRGDCELFGVSKAASDWMVAFDNPNNWVIVQRGAKEPAGKETRGRDGCLGVFRFSDLDLKEGYGCYLEIVERIA
jgi:hypothetical protein